MKVIYENLKYELEEAYAVIKKSFNIHLKDKGLKLSGFNTNFGLTLSYLYLHKDRKEYVNKAELQEVISYVLGRDTTEPQGPRHLARKGWFIAYSQNKRELCPDMEGDDKFKLISITEPIKGYIDEVLRRKDALSSPDFDKKKAAFNFKCATCGSEEGKTHNSPKHSNTIVKLEKGHMDPNKGMAVENIVPQCQICNGHYKDRFIFNENGWVSAINDPSRIHSSPEQVQREIYEILKEKFS